MEYPKGKVLIGMAMSYPPVSPLIEFIEAHRDNYIPIVGGGKAKLEQLGEWAQSNCMTDDGYEGNISHLNDRINEITVLHAMLHDVLPNTNADYYGLCHYRRMFPDEVVASVPTLEYDIINMKPLGMGRSMVDNYMVNHNPNDWHYLYWVLKKRGQIDDSVWSKWCSQTACFGFCNMFIMKRDMFKEHAEVLTSIGEELYSLVDVSGRDDYQKRAPGFLTERADSYLMFKAACSGKYKVGFSDVIVHQDWVSI